MVGLPTLKCFNHHETTILTFIMGTTLRRGRERLSSAEGESCWKNLEESKLAADLGEVRQRSSGVAAASLRKVDSSEVLGAASSEFCILHLSRLSARCCGARSSNLTQIGRSSVLSHIKRSSTWLDQAFGLYSKLSVRPAVVIVSVRPRSYNRAFVRVRPTARSSAFVQLSVRPSYKCSVRPSIGSVRPVVERSSRSVRPSVRPVVDHSSCSVRPNHQASVRPYCLDNVRPYCFVDVRSSGKDVRPNC
ncbi:hypothetical protein LR48_Vigan468s003900 [Vigna angularis]|uniref:Uncharacterized protein n=1 Tax=Phaseolus angularis TaxID=3914 RepID=A0A0L9TBG1_PHAAN|nr:hypothetical protein LR48_Vigan468s003900 [Vigna angularis]